MLSLDEEFLLKSGLQEQIHELTTTEAKGYGTFFRSKQVCMTNRDTCLYYSHTYLFTPAVSLCIEEGENNTKKGSTATPESLAIHL